MPKKKKDVPDAYFRMPLFYLVQASSAAVCHVPDGASSGSSRSENVGQANERNHVRNNCDPLEYLF
jgi:hypothetical protein